MPPTQTPRIIAETDQLLAIDKPAGLIVHSDGRTVEPSLAEWVGERYPDARDVGDPWMSPQGALVRVCGIAHRLDRTTSGIIVAAKTPEMFMHMKNEFKARRVAKVYRAYVCGHMETDRGEIVAEIARTSVAPRRWYARPTTREDQRAAITGWRVLERTRDPHTGEPITYVELYPQTGRTHQLRVHLASIGHPIAGDHLYASERTCALLSARPALHAYRIELNIGGARRTFTAPLPDDMRALGAA